MKKGMGIALAVLVTAVAAASAQGGQRQVQAASAAGLSCKSTLKIAFVTPLTGGAGFLGQEQLSWAKYAVATLAPQMGLKIQLLQGDTPVEQGATPARRLPRSTWPIRRSSRSSARRRRVQSPRRRKTYFQAGLAHVSPSATRTDLTYTVGGTTRGHAGVLPGRACRQHPGPDRCGLHGQHAEGEEGRHLRLPGAVLAGPRGRRRHVPEGTRRHHDPALGPEHDDRLLVVRDQGPERRRRRLLPDAAAAGGADVRRAARRAGQEGDDVRRRRIRHAGAVQQAGRLRVELRPGHQRHRGGQGDPRRLEEGQSRAGPLGSFGPPTYGAVQTSC